MFVDHWNKTWTNYSECLRFLQPSDQEGRVSMMRYLCSHMQDVQPGSLLVYVNPTGDLCNLMLRLTVNSLLGGCVMKLGHILKSWVAAQAISSSYHSSLPVSKKKIRASIIACHPFIQKNVSFWKRTRSAYQWAVDLLSLCKEKFSGFFFLFL